MSSPKSELDRPFAELLECILVRGLENPGKENSNQRSNLAYALLLLVRTVYFDSCNETKPVQCYQSAAAPEDVCPKGQSYH